MSPRPLEGANAILLSGGPGSAWAALWAARTMPGNLVGVFFDHGQEGAEEAVQATQYVALRLAITLLRFDMTPVKDGKQEAFIREVAAMGAVRAILGTTSILGPFGALWLRETAVAYGIVVACPSAWRIGWQRDRELIAAGIFPARLADIPQSRQ